MIPQDDKVKASIDLSGGPNPTTTKGNPKDFVDSKTDDQELKKQEKTGELLGVAVGEALPDNWEKDSTDKMVERAGTVYLFKKFKGKWYRVAMTAENP